MKKVIITLAFLLVVCIACAGLSACGDAEVTTQPITTTTTPTAKPDVGNPNDEFGIPEQTTTVAVTTTEAPPASGQLTSEGLAYGLNENGSGYVVTGMGTCEVSSPTFSHLISNTP